MSSHSRPVFWPRLAFAVGLGIYLGMLVRWFYFADHYAVNMLYFDQWDLYRAFIGDKSAWQVLVFQHGPHRQGPGFFLTQFLAGISDWNTRWDAFVVAGSIAAASAFGVVLAIRSGVVPAVAFAGAGLIFFNLRQYEIVLNSPNLCVGALPLLLLMACACCWFIPAASIRLPLIGGLTMILILSGYGLFAGLLIPVLLALEGIQAWRAGEKRHVLLVGMALGFCAVGWGIFAKDYVFSPAVDGFQFPHPRPWEYLFFAGVMLSNLCGISGFGPTAIVCGSVLFFVLAGVSVWHGWKLMRSGVSKNPVSAAVFLLAAFALLFSFNAAVGRVLIGVDAGLTSRYVTLMATGAFALFLHCAAGCPSRVRPLSLVLLVLFAFGTWGFKEYDRTNIAFFHHGQTSWKAAYLQTRDIEQANRISGFEIYPWKPRMGFVLEHMEKHRLNLFAPGEAETVGN